MPALEPNWHRQADRTSDPRIRRGPISKAILTTARRATKGRSFNFLRVLTIDGRLVLPYLVWNSRLMPRGKLSRSQTEAVILRTAWLCGSEYEWTQHRAIGRSVGMSQAQLEAAGPEPDSDCFDELTRLLLGGVEQLLNEHRLSDATYDALRAELPPARILEYVMLVGTYSALAGALNSFGVQLEEHWAQS